MTTANEIQIVNIINDAEEVLPSGSTTQPASGKGKVTQAEKLISLAEAADLFHTSDPQAYADITVDGHRETWLLSSPGFAKWLRHVFYKATGGAPTQQSLAEACRMLEAKAQFDSPTREVHLRVASADGKLYLDLGDETWAAVEITPARWQVVGNPPVRFRRTKGMRPLPVPQAGGSIDDLRPFLNLQSHSDFVLVVSWLLACLRDRGPYPVLAVTGEQGSAKSTFSRTLRKLVDPNAVPLRALPRNEPDVHISASNGHLLAFDNVSRLPHWLSDTLCQLATGGGFATRALYTNEEEKLFNASRPILLNGIVDIVERPDLAGRALFLSLAPISDKDRRTEGSLDSAFSEAQPKILGALLDAIATGLNRLPDIASDQFPRMADFAQWATACETAYCRPGTFKAAYEQNRKEAVEQIVNVDPVADAVQALVTDQGRWSGTATELLETLSAMVGIRAAGSRSWPSTPQELSGRLTRFATFLRSAGIEILHFKEGRARTRKIVVHLIGEEQNGAVLPANDDQQVVGEAKPRPARSARSSRPAVDPDEADGADDESTRGDRFDIPMMQKVL